MKINNSKYAITIVFLFLTMSLAAQRIIKEGRYKVNERTLVIKKERERLIVTEEYNKAISDFKNNPKIYIRINQVKFNGKNTIASVFASTLGEARVQHLQHSGYVLVTLYPNRDGSISAVQLYTKSNVGLTIEEMDKLIVSLKEKLIIDTPIDVGKTSKIAPVSQVIHFNKL